VQVFADVDAGTSVDRDAIDAAGLRAGGAQAGWPGRAVELVPIRPGAIELLADLDAASLPNLRWGRGLGGFASDVLFVNDPNTSRLFSLPVGVPGAPAFY